MTQFEKTLICFVLLLDLGWRRCIPISALFLTLIAMNGFFSSAVATMLKRRGMGSGTHVNTKRQRHQCPCENEEAVTLAPMQKQRGSGAHGK